MANVNEYKSVVEQYVSQINQTFAEAFDYCRKEDLSLLYPGDSQNYILKRNNTISSIWLNMKKTSFLHLMWIDNSTLGWYSILF